MPTKDTGVKTFNYIRDNSSENFKNVVPYATADNINDLENILFDDSYQPMLNEFVGNLINRIAFTIISNRSFDNPLRLLKKGSVPLGTDIQDIYTNPATAEKYELSNAEMAKLLTITDPDTHVAYYRRNRQDLYTKTIAREALRGAFVSWDKFNQFIEGIVTALYSGNYIDEFKYTKSMVDGAYDNNKAIIEIVDDPIDEASEKALVKKVRSLFMKMTLPSTNYNAYSKLNPNKGTITTWTTSERIIFITTADLISSIDVDLLSAAFNMDKTNFLGRVIVVDEFENPQIKGVIADESWLQIYDNLLRFDEFYNARVMAWNEYLHAWGTFAISPFANAVILATENPVPATSIAFGNGADVNIVGVGTQEGLELTITPENATTDIEYKSGDVNVFTVSKVDNKNSTLTATGIGTSTLTATSDNNLSTTINVNVTAE